MIKQLAAVLLLAAAVAAQEKQPPPPTVPLSGNTTYHLEFTVTELEGAKKLHTRNYSVIVGDGKDARLRVGNRIPIVTGKEEQIQYMDVGANFDVRPIWVDARTVRLRAILEVSALAASDSSRRPVLRNFNNALETNVPLDKQVLLTSQDEPGTEITFQVHLVARIAR